MLDLLAALRAHAAATPCRPFLLLGQGGTWQQFSFADTLRETERCASQWASLRLAPGTVVCTAIPHSADLYFLFLGAMRAGLVPAFLAFPTPKQSADVYWSGLRSLLEWTRPGCVVVASGQREAVAAIVPASCLVLDPAGLASVPPLPEPLPEIAGERLALLQHSSGTTGAKKGVCLTFEQIRHQVDAYAAAISMTPADKVVSWLPLYHDMGLITGFLLPLSVGATVVSLDAFEWLARPSLFFEAIGLVGATLAWLPNFAFSHLVRVHDPGEVFALHTMRAFINCSEPCKPATMQAFAATFAASGVRPGMLLTCYAMAETVFAVTQSRPGAFPATLAVDRDALQRHGTVAPMPAGQAGSIAVLSCGPPIEGAGIAIVDADGSPVAPSTVGEIVVRGGFVFGGYYRNPEATAKAFAAEGYRTGDLGFLHEGELYLTGRIKDVIIVHGRNYYAHDIEAAVAEVCGVKPGRVVALGAFSEANGSEEVVVVAETAHDDADAHPALRRSVRQHVFDVLELTIGRIEFTGPGLLVKTTSGKMSREENVRRFGPGERALQVSAAHR